MEFALEQLYSVMGHYFWVFCRVGAFFLVVPIIGTKLVPARIRLGLALATSLLVASAIPSAPAIDPFTFPSFVIVVQQFLIGAVMGFMVQIMFQVFIIGGQMVAMQNGLGFGTLMDPVNGISVTSISQLYLMTTNLLFFSMNGHISLIRLLSNSFYTFPMEAGGLPADHFFFLVSQGSWMFSGAILVALPAVMSLLVVNFTFGVMSRVAPQMNIIAIGFPFTMVLGLVIIWLTLANVMPQFERLFEEVFILLDALVTK